MTQAPPSRPKVLHVFADPATGTNLVAGIAKAAVKAGYDVEFACNTGEFMPMLEKLGLPVHLVPMSRKVITLDHVRALLALRRLMKRRQYDIVHTHTPFASFIGRAAAHLAGIPVVIYHMRGSAWERGSSVTRTTFTWLERLAARWTNVILTVNCDDAGDVIRYGILPARQVQCLHCGASGLNLAAYGTKSASEIAALRSTLGATSDDVVIGFVGRLVREKGLFDLLAAFQRIAAELPALRLVLVGGALASDRDQTAVRELRATVESDAMLSKRILFTGFRSDVPDLMSAMDVVVQPSYREGFANILAEAAAAGRAAIGANTRGVREVVEPDATGIITPVGDVEALEAAIRRLATDAVLRQTMGAQGRRRALARFDQRIPCGAVLACYDRLLGRLAEAAV